MSIVTEHLLFATHQGTVGDSQAGIFMAGHCLPLACSHGSWEKAGVPWTEAGIYACWEATTDVEEFFGDNGLNLGSGIKAPSSPKDSEKHPGMKPNGLYVYTVSYNTEEALDAADDDWPWLQGGSLRRPTLEELEPLARGQAPWGGVVL